VWARFAIAFGPDPAPDLDLFGRLAAGAVARAAHSDVEMLERAANAQVPRLFVRSVVLDAEASGPAEKQAAAEGIRQAWREMQPCARGLGWEAAFAVMSGLQALAAGSCDQGPAAREARRAWEGFEAEIPKWEARIVGDQERERFVSLHRKVREAMR
jgi:hypothetical protein